MSKVIVVGGGASGMMAAYSAASIGHNVILLEKNNKLGKKIYITGKGRCNVTNASNIENYMNHIVSNPKFLYSAFSSFNNEDLMKLMEENGCPLKTERGNRVFPVSDHASDITKTLEKLLNEYHVDIRLNEEVSNLIVESHVVKGVISNGKALFSDDVIIATGGLCYPATGSTGSGYKFAKDYNIEVKKCLPALVPFNVKEDYIKDLQGLSLKNVGIQVYCNKKKEYEDFGELLFTHFGVSGPTILSASSNVSDSFNKTLIIDLKPALITEKLDERILRDFKSNSNKQIDKVIGQLLPVKLGLLVLDLCDIPSNKVIHDITKEERSRLVYTIKNFKCTLTGFRSFNEAIITKGGVKVSEVNPKTLESKKMKGLYFVGEVLDVDALTGGYNLTIAFSTGYLAGKSIEYK